MEEEIDLRPYIKALLRGWKWVVGATILAGAITFLVASFAPPNYEATALVAVVEARDIMQFDSRIRETDAPQPLKAFPQLALSDQILRLVMNEITIEGVDTVAQLREKLNAEAGSDVTLIELKATSESPTEAAEIANNWATIFVDWANEVYGDTSQEQVQFFEAQLVKAETELATAEESLIEYQAVNQQLLATNRLNILSQTHAELMNSKQILASLAQDAQALRDQFMNYGENMPITLADQLVTLLMQIRVFDSSLNENTTIPFQLQLDANTSLTSESREEHVDLLDNLLDTLTTLSAQIEAELAQLEPQLLELQQQKQQAETEFNRLMRQQAVAEETYTILARKVEEERITSSDTNSGVRLASRAIVPTRPLGSGRLLLALVASIISGLFSITWISAQQWWQVNSKHEIMESSLAS